MASIKKIRQNIWLKEAVVESIPVRSLLILSDDTACIWDTLAHPDEMQEFIPLIGDRKVKIIYSHGDWDHIWGTSVFRDKNPEIIGHENCLLRFSRDIPDTLSRKIRHDPRYREVKLVPPGRVFQSSLTIWLGKSPLHLYHLPGHTEDSIVGYLEEEKILLLGDTVETPLPDVPGEADLQAWKAELAKLCALSDDILAIPSHGEIGDRTVIEKTIDYLDCLEKNLPARFPEKLEPFYLEMELNNRMRRFSLMQH